ncbi:MAG: hypothetical protein JST90_17420 [Bacteroidetes bacterium]|nr:hypothetical protein [Bacteroidota bacterium]
MSHVERFGALVPSSNTTVEDELAQYLRLPSSESVRFHIGRLDYNTRISVSYQDYCQEICAKVVPAMTTLEKVKDIRSIGFFCTTCSLYLSDPLFSSIDNPISAIAKTCFASGIVSPLVITPYTDEITSRILSKLPFHSIVSSVNINKLTASELGGMNLDTLLEITKNNFDHTKHDSTIILCTNLPSLHLAKVIRYFTSKPFISSNLAMISAMQNIAIDRIIEQMP